MLYDVVARNTELKEHYEFKGIELPMKAIELKLQAALVQVSALAQMAASALNGLNAQGTVSRSDIKTTSL